MWFGFSGILATLWLWNMSFPAKKQSAHVTKLNNIQHILLVYHHPDTEGYQRAFCQFSSKKSKKFFSCNNKGGFYHRVPELWLLNLIRIPFWCFMSNFSLLFKKLWTFLVKGCSHFIKIKLETGQKPQALKWLFSFMVGINNILRQLIYMWTH